MPIYEKLGIFHDFTSEIKVIENGSSINTICSEILKDFNFLYGPDERFYEYDGQVWKQRDDSFMRTLIMIALGDDATSNKINQVFRALKQTCYKNVDFNQKEVIVFQNGTLDLPTGVLRNSEASDYTTIQLNFDYSEDAICPMWTDFISDVMNNSSEKITLLKQIAGYLLFPGNPLKTCFYLIGDGFNGRGVFSRVLANVFGEENVSPVFIRDLKIRSDRIFLKNSVFNVTRGNVKYLTKPTKVFKDFISGELINGGYKQKNTITFSPRAKLICIADDMDRLSEIDEKIRDHVVLIRFDQVYDNYPGHKKCDPCLREKLITEKQGIFNWLYSGYRELKAQGTFSLTEEHFSLLGYSMPNKAESSPDHVASFVQSLDVNKLGSKFKSSDLYNQYKEWCAQSGIDCLLNLTHFGRKFKKYFLSTHKKWNYKHGNKGSFYYLD